MNPATGDLEFADCFETKQYLCQIDQTPHPDFIEKMGWWPNYVHPMVNITETSSEEFVGFLDNPVRQTELKKSAGFTKKISKMEDILPETFQSEYGFTIGLWLRIIDDVTREQIILVIDSQVIMKLTDGKPTVVLCSDETCGSSEEITSHSILEVNTWNFIAFTYNTKDSVARIYVNETFGLDDKEGHFSNLTSNIWFGKVLDTEAGELGFKIEYSGTDDDKLLHGEISCVQVYTKELSASQIYQVSKICHVPVEFPRSKFCPPDSHLIGTECFKFFSTPTDFVNAELECTSEPNKPPSIVGYPSSYQLQQDLALIAKETYGVNAFFVGLDSYSGI